MFFSDSCWETHCGDAGFTNLLPKIDSKMFTSQTTSPKFYQIHHATSQTQKTFFLKQNIIVPNFYLAKSYFANNWFHLILMFFLFRNLSFKNYSIVLGWGKPLEILVTLSDLNLWTGHWPRVNFDPFFRNGLSPEHSLVASECHFTH